MLCGYSAILVHKIVHMTASDAIYPAKSFLIHGRLLAGRNSAEPAMYH